LRRLLEIALAGCLGLALTYLVGMNLFLQTQWFRHAISFSPEQFRVEYARAYSILPGQIHVEGLRIRGSDTSVEWILELDRCDFHVQFLDLLHRKFHADHVRGSGLSMRLRLRLKQEEATPEVAAALPPVPGFSDPPYLEIGPPTLPLTDANYNLWAIQLDDVDAQHVREVWIHTLRYSGDMRVRGRWLFRPVRWLEIGPATVEVSALDVSYGPTKALLSRLHGAIETTVHPFDVREPDGLEILRYVSAKTWLSGDAETAHLLDEFAPSPSWRLVRGEGPMDLQLVVDHGALRPGSRLQISSPETEVLTSDLSLYAGIAAELRVDSDGEQSVARSDIGVSNLRAIKQDVELARAASVSIRLESHDVDLAHPSLDAASFAVELNGAYARTVAILNPVLPAGVAADSGVFRGDGHLEGRLDDESAQGQLGFTIRALSLARGPDRVGANVQGVLKLESGSLRDGSKIDLSDSRIALGNVVAKVVGVHLRAPEFAMHATRAVMQRGARPDLDVDFGLPTASLTDLRDVDALLPTGASVTGGRATVSGSASLRLRARTVMGTASLATEGLGMSLGHFALTTGMSARAASGQWKWGAHSVEMSGADIVLHDLTVADARGGPSLFTLSVLAAQTPHVRFSSEGRTGIISVDVPSAKVPDVRALAKLLTFPKNVTVARGEATASAHLEGDVSSLSASGTANLVAGGLRVQVGHDAYDGELDVAIRATDLGIDGETTTFSGSTVAFTSSGAPSTEAWWARVTLPTAELQLAGVPHFRGTVHLTAKNASPVQALLARVTPVPRWVLDAFPTDDLRADGEIDGTPSSIELRSVAVKSSGTSVQLEYAKHDADAQGMALISSGSLRVGVRFAGAGQKFLLFGAEGWFERQVAALRARTHDLGTIHDRDRVSTQP
jgi:hypothetical protein